MQSKLPSMLVVICVLLCLCCAACNGDAIEFPERTVKLPDLSAPASIQGEVHFDGVPPRRVRLELDSDAWCRGPASEVRLSESVIVTDGRLADTLVWVEKGLEAYVWPLVKEPAVLSNKNCMYVPHVLAVQAYQPVRFVSEDGTAHNINTSGSAQGSNRSLSARGEEFTIQFRQPEMSIPARCNIHPWMEGFIHVLPHPNFAVTGPDGRYRLPPLPPGTYTITAVHPKLGTKSASVTVAASGQATQDFHFTKR